MNSQELGVWSRELSIVNPTTELITGRSFLFCGDNTSCCAPSRSQYSQKIFYSVLQLLLIQPSPKPCTMDCMQDTACIANSRLDQIVVGQASFFLALLQCRFLGLTYFESSNLCRSPYLGMNIIHRMNQMAGLVGATCYF